MSLEKQILRENATTATLTTGAGAQELQDNMIGISTDDETIMFRVGANFFHTVNSASTWTDESIPFADANNRMVEDTDFSYSLGNERLSVKNMQLVTDFMHYGDDHTKWTFGDDSIQIDVGGVVYWNMVEDATDYCEFNSGEVDIDFIINGDLADLLYCDAGNNRVGINTNAPSRTFQIEANPATDNAVTYLARQTLTTSGTAAAGFGTGTEFVLEADDGATDIDGAIECILTDATGGAVESALVFKTMDEGDDGLAERLRIDKDGMITFTGGMLFSGAAKANYRDTAIGVYSQADTFMDLFADGAIRIGDSSAGAPTNYANFAPDGELTLAGTARVTKKVFLDNGALGTGGTVPSQVIIGNFNAWEFDINDDAVVDWAIPSDWATGTDVIVNASWYCNEAYATNSGEVRFQVDWSACPHDNSEAIDAPTHTGSDDSGDIDIPATAKYLREDTIVTIPGASLALGDEIGLTLSRIALAGGSDPTADPGIIHLEIVYTADKLGTAT